MDTELNEGEKRHSHPKWDKCVNEGYSLMLGGMTFGTLASMMTRSFGPLLLMGSVGLFAAVENCDNVFGSKKDQ